MTPYYETELGKLYHGDCLEIMPEIETVDLVLTSPPYNVGLDYGDNVDDNKDPQEYWDWYENLLGILFKNEDLILYLISGMIHFDIVKQMGIKGGFTFVQWLWLRRRNLVGSSPRWPWIPTIQPVAMFKNGKRKPMLSETRGINTFDVCDYTAAQSNFKKNKRCHPAQDGVEAYFKIVARTPGGITMDPFLGSGTTAIACERLNRRWIGIEIEEKYCEISAKRIEKERSQLKLFA